MKLRNSSYLLIEMAITRLSLNCIDKFIAHEMSEKNIHVYFASASEAIGLAHITRLYCHMINNNRFDCALAHRAQDQGSTIQCQFFASLYYIGT